MLPASLLDETGPSATVRVVGERKFLVTRTRGENLWRAFAELRRVSAPPHIEALGESTGFRIEDLLFLRATTPGEPVQDEAWLRRRLPHECELYLRPAADADVLLEAVFARRGETDFSQRRTYERTDGRIRVEAFELHVVEHCNLKCAHCCNMSPYLDAKFLSVEEVAAQCRTMARHLAVDVFKIMGGEPLLHPHITEVLHAIRSTGISDIVRLFTNGLLLHKMTDDFWQALDHLTVSNYSSAPLKPAQLELIEERARAFDVVLNVKPVDRFSRVMNGTRRTDDAATQATYDDCWLRHRCLIVRNGAFYKCTRASYFADFQARVTVDEREPDPQAAMRDDGVPIDAADFGARLLEYLNRRTPLSACRYCLGSSGPLEPHAQLTRDDIRAGRLDRR